MKKTGLKRSITCDIMVSVDKRLRYEPLFLMVRFRVDLPRKKGISNMMAGRLMFYFRRSRKEGQNEVGNRLPAAFVLMCSPLHGDVMMI